MATKYCNLGNAFSNPADVGDASGNPANGPGGFLSMLYGWGNHDKLAAGDTLWVQGRGNLEKLVKITVGLDSGDQGWAVADTVRNDTGDGDHWEGKIVYYDGATGVCWVQLDTLGSYDDVNDNQADGIENTTQAEVDSISAVACNGIEMNTGVAEGTETGGRIAIRGTTDLTDAAANKGLAYLDGNGEADHCIWITNDNTDWYEWEYISFEYAAGDGFDTSSGTIQYNYHYFEHCRWSNNGGIGTTGYGGVMNRWVLCIFANNTSHGIQSAYGPLVWCLIYGNGAYGAFLEYGLSHALVQCVLRDNTDDNLCWYRQAAMCLVHGCLFEDSAGDSGILVTGDTYVEAGTFTLACRATNNPAYGIEYDLATTAEALHIERYNVFYGNVSGDLDLTDGLGSDTSYGDDSNHISDPADDGLDANYNVEDGKEHDSTEVVLNWDE